MQKYICISVTAKRNFETLNIQQVVTQLSSILDMAQIVVVIWNMLRYELQEE